MTEGRGSASVETMLLTAEEAAIVLGIGRTKVFEMLAARELPAIRIGRCVRISRRELERWIDGQLEDAGFRRARSGEKQPQDAGASRPHRGDG